MIYCSAALRRERGAQAGSVELTRFALSVWVSGAGGVRMDDGALGLHWVASALLSAQAAGCWVLGAGCSPQRGGERDATVMSGRAPGAGLMQPPSLAIPVCFRTSWLGSGSISPSPPQPPPQPQRRPRLDAQPSPATDDHQVDALCWSQYVGNSPSSVFREAGRLDRSRRRSASFGTP